MPHSICKGFVHSRWMHTCDIHLHPSSYSCRQTFRDKVLLTHKLAFVTVQRADWRIATLVTSCVTGGFRHIPHTYNAKCTRTQHTHTHTAVLVQLRFCNQFWQRWQYPDAVYTSSLFQSIWYLHTCGAVGREERRHRVERRVCERKSAGPPGNGSARVMKRACALARWRAGLLRELLPGTRGLTLITDMW